jgi:ATP-dependent Zn protease
LLSSRDPAALLALQAFLEIPSGRRPRSEHEYDRVRAFHEAGHAVVGTALGRKVANVGIQTHCEFEPLKREWESLDVENSAKIALAGPHAEARASQDGVCVGAGGDLPQAKDHAQELAGRAWKARLKQLSREAKRLVDERWTEIEAFARTLLGKSGRA